MRVPTPKVDVDSDSDGFEILTNLNPAGQASPDSDDDIDAEDLVDAAVDLLSGNSSDSDELIESIAVHHTLCPMVTMLVTERVLKEHDLEKNSRGGEVGPERIKQLIEDEESLETQQHHLDNKCRCSMGDVLESLSMPSTLNFQRYQCQPADTQRAIQDEVRKAFRELQPSELLGVLFNVTLSPASRTEDGSPSVVSFGYLGCQTASGLRFLGFDAVGSDEGKPVLRSTASMERGVAVSYVTSQLLEHEPFRSFEAYFVTMKIREEPLVPTPSGSAEEILDDLSTPLLSKATKNTVDSAVTPTPSTTVEETAGPSTAPVPSTATQGTVDMLLENLELHIEDDEIPPPYSVLDEAPSPPQRPSPVSVPPPVSVPQPFAAVNNHQDVVPRVEVEARAEPRPARPSPAPQEEVPPTPIASVPELRSGDPIPKPPTPPPAQKRKAVRKPSAQDWMFSLQNKSVILPSPVSPAREPTPPPDPQQSTPTSALMPKKPANRDVSWMLALQNAPPAQPTSAQSSKKGSSSNREDPRMKQDPADNGLRARKAAAVPKEVPVVASSSKLEDGPVKVYGAEQLGLLFGSGPSRRRSKVSEASSGLVPRGIAKDGSAQVPKDEQVDQKRDGKTRTYENTDAWDPMPLEQDLPSKKGKGKDKGKDKGKGKGKQLDNFAETKESSYRTLRNDFAWQVALAATSLKPSEDYLKERDERTKKLKVKLGQVPFDCLVCFETIEWEDGARMTDCEHSFCRDCIEGHIQSKLDENQYPITCPVCLADRDRKTRGYVEEALIIDLALPDKLHERFVELQIAQLSIKIECPGCRNSMQIAREDYLAEPFIWCPLPGCCQQFCRACREITINEGKDHACKIDEALDELMQANGWRYCPGCRTPTQKVSGCNHMTCGAPGCSTHFCYTCGASIWDSRSARSLGDCISTHYANCVHFDPPGQAPNPPANAAANLNANGNPRLRILGNRRRAAECFHQ